MSALTIQHFENAKSNIAALIAEVTSNPKPSYWVEGRQYKWGEYLKQLSDQYDWLEAKLASEAALEDGGGVFETGIIMR